MKINTIKILIYSLFIIFILTINWFDLFLTLCEGSNLPDCFENGMKSIDPEVTQKEIDLLEEELKKLNENISNQKIKNIKLAACREIVWYFCWYVGCEIELAYLDEFIQSNFGDR